MSTYIKGGIVTKITILDKNAFQENKLKEYFDLNLYTKDKNNYYLKEYILNKSIKSYREEILKLTNSKADSIENSEAYILNTNANIILGIKRQITKIGFSFKTLDNIAEYILSNITYTINKL